MGKTIDMDGKICRSIIGKFIITRLRLPSIFMPIVLKMDKEEKNKLNGSNFWCRY